MRDLIGTLAARVASAHDPWKGLLLRQVRFSTADPEFWVYTMLTARAGSLWPSMATPTLAALRSRSCIGILKCFRPPFSTCHKDCVDPVDDNLLFKGAIEGVLSALDPHSAYLDAVSVRELETT